MAKKTFQGAFAHGKNIINLNLTVYTWNEGGLHFAYSPALDITGYGSSDQESRDSFEITLKEFIDYTHNKNTIYDELEHLGWTVNRKKRRVHSPSIEDLLDENDDLKKVINKRGVRREEKNVELALA